LGNEEGNSNPSLFSFKKKKQANKQNLLAQGMVAQL
jgi:hypothetical protein